MTGFLKSQEEFYLRLHAQLIRCDPLALSTSNKTSFERDISYMNRRYRSEGLSFLTKTLPKLGKALDQALVSGTLNIPFGFGTVRNTKYPAFMQVYFRVVFDEDGILREEFDIGALKHLRQVLLFAYKLEVPYSKAETSRVIEKFIRVDAELEICDNPLAIEYLSLAKIITRSVFHGFNHLDISPQHGPGAVATGEKGDDKWTMSRCYSSIDSVYPFTRYFQAGGLVGWIDQRIWGRNFEQPDHGCAKVVLVPKDSRGPRLISCEPLEFQWIQQGLGRKLASFLEMGSPITVGQINFTRQDVNSNIAKTSSASQRFATIDLEDASDRVSLELVKGVFNSLQLARALEACRTTETKLPNGRVVTLKKFAPMGSALCFPVESYVFWVLIVSAIIRESNLSLDRVGKLVYVYGDDIIVPTEYAELSIQVLEMFGLKVNRLKSCITGYFRESCGTEAYKGIDVTPVRLKKPWTNRKSDGSALASYTALANAFALRGYSDASDLLWTELDVLYGLLPYGTNRASYPCRIINDPVRAEALNRRTHRWRFNRGYQRVEFLLPSLSSRKVKSKLDGWPRLLRGITMDQSRDPSHIVVRRSIQIKRRWAGVA